MQAQIDEHGPEPGYVSTGHLPSPEYVQTLLHDAHERFGSNMDGENSQVYPALARVPSDLFGICVVATSGTVYAVGDTEHEFSIMSVSKPFIFALVCELLGPSAMRDKIGVNATGLPFNSLAAVESSADGRTNPMVNAGAIATTSLVPGADEKEKWKFIHDGLSRFAGRTLPLNDEVYASASETNFRNRSIAWLLETRNTIYCDPREATDLYTRQCSLNVSAKDLAVMGATLADGGVNPITRERVVDALGLPLRAGCDDRSPECTKPPVNGFTISACRAKAESAVGSSLCLRGRAAWEPSLRRSTPRETVLRGSSSRSSCPNGSGWICSCRNPKSDIRSGVPVRPDCLFAPTLQIARTPQS